VDEWVVTNTSVLRTHAEKCVWVEVDDVTDEHPVREPVCFAIAAHEVDLNQLFEIEPESARDAHLIVARYDHIAQRNP
jgi:hypothetical protein